MHSETQSYENGTRGCPSHEELADFVFGRSSTIAGRIAPHIDECNRCRKLLAEFSSVSDPLIMQIRTAASFDMPTEPPAGSIAGETLPSVSHHPAEWPQFSVELVALGLVTADELVALGIRFGAEQATSAVSRTVEELKRIQRITEFQAEVLLKSNPAALAFGECVVYDRIGEGGMGQVYLAKHRKMHRMVALKVLTAGMRHDPEAVKRFEREVAAAAILLHTNIVTAFDAGEKDGRWYLVMEYVDGQDLSRALKNRGPLPVWQAVDYTAQAAKGLAFAHERNVIHRDIKPSNLLVDSQGTVKILDLGLARIGIVDGVPPETASDELTQAGIAMGTLDYMAPEQFLDSSQAGPKADVYALGCTLFRLLTGKPPYTGTNAMQKAVAHREAPIPSLIETRSDTPLALDRLLQRMLAKRPEARPSAGEVASQLDDILRHRDEMAARLDVATQQPQLSEGGGRRPPMKLIAAGGAGFLFACFGVWVVLYDRDNREVGRMQIPDGGVAKTIMVRPERQDDAQPEPTTAFPALKVAAKTIGATPPTTKSPFTRDQARKHQQDWAAHLGSNVESKNSIGMRMTLVPPGEFLMGSTDAQVESALADAVADKADDYALSSIRDAERPQHRVVITKPFFIGTTEVTIGEFKVFARDAGYKTEAEAAGVPITYLTPRAGNVTGDLPAIGINWQDAIVFCEWLTKREQQLSEVGSPRLIYRLPTEAEWEFACRAGSTTAYSFGDDRTLLGQHAWFRGSATSTNRPVGTKLPNGFGIHDMHGSVREWCSDWFEADWYGRSPKEDPVGPKSGVFRSVRDGNAGHGAYVCRSASRGAIKSPFALVGFRCVCEIERSVDR